MGSKINRFIVLVQILCIAMMITACNNRGDSEYSGLEKLGLYEVDKSVIPEVKGDITLISNKVDTFNPLQTRNFYVSSFLNLVYEPLFKTDSKLANIPVLAEEAIASEENKVWTVYLHSGVKWHDGSDFTAEDVVYTYDVLMNKKYKGSYKSNVDNVISVTVGEDDAVVFVLQESDPAFMYKLSVPIISSNHISLETAVNYKKSKNIKPIGTGPYYFNKKTKKGYVALRNETWHIADDVEDEYDGARPPFIKKINLNVYNNFADSQSALLKNEIDIFPTGEAKKTSSVKSTGFNISAITTNSFDCITVNHNSDLFTDVNVRRAFSCFIDRNDMIDKCYKDRMTASEMAVLPSDKTWTHLMYSFNVKQAETYLEDSGWKNHGSYWMNKDGEYFNIDLLIDSSSSTQKKIANTLKSNLAEYGINVYVKSYARDKYLSLLEKGDYEAAILNYNLSTSNDFTPFYASKKMKGYLNYSNYINKEFDALVAQWRSECDATTKANIYAKMRNIIVNDLPIIGLASSSVRILYSRRIQGSLDPVNRYPYSNLAFCYIS